MLSDGDRIPDISVWTAPREKIALHDLGRERPALYLFYLFDWSST